MLNQVSSEDARQIKKRSGNFVPFEIEKLKKAISKTIISVRGTVNGEVDKIANAVLNNIKWEELDGVPYTDVESVQNEVERQMIFFGLVEVARAFISFRQQRAMTREKVGEVSKEVRELARESSKYFEGNPLGEFVYLRTYARWIEEEGRRETWIETVDRYMSFMRENLNGKLNDAEYSDIREAILRQEIMPSMRLLQFSGPAARRCNMVAFNCSYIAPSKIDDFGEILYLSASGTGVGFSVETLGVQQLPIVKRQRGVSLKTHVVADSREGWADALVHGMKAWYNGKDVDFDFSKIRPSGARLKTTGGKASGPGPLKSLLEFARERILARQGRRLTNIDVHDIICKIGEAIVSGGVRRTAMISLSDLDDGDMRDAKTGAFYMTHPHRSLANNSAVYTEKPSGSEFLLEWANLVGSGSGERGIFNRGALMGQLPKRRIEKWKEMGVVEDDVLDGLIGTNPCAEIILTTKQTCVKGDTPIITRSDGIQDIENLVGKTVDVWNGDSWSTVTPVVTGRDQRMVRVTFSDGSYLDCTTDHKFSVKHRFKDEWEKVEAKDLLEYSDYAIQVEPTVVGDHAGTEEVFGALAYDMGFAFGDGNVSSDGKRIETYAMGSKIDLPLSGRRLSRFRRQGYSVDTQKIVFDNACDSHVDHFKLLRTAEHSLRTLAKAPREEILRFFAGWIDADGSGTVDGGVRLYMSGEDRARDAQLLLSLCGVRSSVNLMQRRGSQTNYGVRRDDLWYLQITDARTIPCNRVDTSRGHVARFKGKYQTIVDVMYIEGEHTSYCFEEKEHHKAVFGNVLTYQCNLSEVIARNGDTEDDLMRKIKLATILGTYQSTLTNFKYLSPEWKENCDAERLLGVSITGQWDCPTVRNAEVMSKLRDEAIRVNRVYSRRFGVQQSTAVTAVKPSGTVSQTVDCSSGMHPRHSQYYIRRIRISATDSLFKMLKDQGVPCTPEVGQTPENATTYVLDFPVKAPDGSVFKDDLTAIQQLEYWKMVKVNYTEHNPSVTVSVGDNEWIEVADWVYKNWDIVGGLSFLPRSNHVYMLAPYEEITKEQYEELVKRFGNVDYSKLVTYELQDETEMKKELACAGGTCEIN